MPFFTHAGVRLAYDRTGSGPPVLLVHGWTANRTYWKRQVQALRDRCTVIAADLRGHGESSHPPKGYTIGALVADLEQLVRALRVPKIAVVGWSMGGMVAIELARRLGERVSALGLVSTSAGGFLDAKKPAIDPEGIAKTRAGLAEDPRAFLRGLAPHLFKAGPASPLVPWAAGEMQKTAAHVATACYEALLAFDARPHLASLRVKTAVLHGEHDRLIPLAAARTLAKGIAGAELVVFPESGHAPPLEEPEAFNAALERLLA